MSVSTEPLPKRQSASASAGAWHTEAIFYKIPLKSFFDGNGDGIGDFVGLTAKLNYLQELGITCLWLLPFFPSPWNDDGYDVSDYRAVHPSYGTMHDFETFLAAAHERNLRVVAEVPINHTSNRHPWFEAAREAPADSPLRDFYVWRDTTSELRDTSEAAGSAAQANWTFDPKAQAFYWHRFYDHEPDLNYDCPEVRSEITKVLRFWLDRGLDGVCLNGASFLFDREGSSGDIAEHAPQTHAFLKSLRRELEDDYPHCVLQAGLNARPEDAADYFGASDECQLAPHVPLAQRLFLALSQEDRHPLVDILRRTPTPPPDCSWVFLLRNHDELTLSPATEEERDQFFERYAADDRMRMRGGIARRLAPLVDNSRRQLELLFGLLFALPGAPLVYYGDEIGMGDNVYLNDRTAMRTPMQWTGERNGGFSTADTVRLFAAPVVDPVYGYQAVNVEAQRRSHNSLFRWLRRLIALRKSAPTLAHGDCEILDASNNKILAFVRRDDRRAIVVVANLARVVQPVALELPEFAGSTPVEMFGRVPFPRLTGEPWTLTLAPHACYWFALEDEPSGTVSRFAPVPLEQIDALPSLTLGESPLERFSREDRTAIERILPKYLKSQRWFGGKARQVDAVVIDDWGPLADNVEAIWTILSVRFSDGGTHRYLLPLAISAHEKATRIYERSPAQSIAFVETPAGRMLLHDATASDEVCATLLDLIGSANETPLRNGTIRPAATEAYAPLRGDTSRPLAAVRGPATSSNSLVFYGKRFILKLFRRLGEGVNPDFEIGRFLTEQGNFRRVPRTAGTIELHATGAEPTTLAILQETMTHQGDGWEHALEGLGRYYERADGRRAGPDPIAADERSLVELSEATPSPTALEAIAGYLHVAAVLGRQTAELHTALAADFIDPAFAPEPVAPADLAHLRHAVEQQAEQALAQLGESLPNLDGTTRDAARQLIDRNAARRSPTHDGHVLNGDIPRPKLQALKIRCHGDYHLGQILWSGHDFIILDFEGEPSRSLTERREKQSSLKDVAGMLRSFHYAAYAGLFTFTTDRPHDLAALEPWAELWRQWTSATFLGAYRRTMHGRGIVPDDAEAFAELLDSYLLEKAYYELSYELNNRPTWVRIPLGGIIDLAAADESPRAGAVS